MEKFSSKIVEEYYEALIELVTAIMSANGWRTRAGDTGAHIESIEHMRSYKEITEVDITLMDDLRKKRNAIKYYGKNIEPGFLIERENKIVQLLEKLTAMAK